MSSDDEERENSKGFEDDNEFSVMNKSRNSKTKPVKSRCALTKKNKVIWTPYLHNKFLKAIEKLGVDRAVPTKIIDLMKVDGLTRDHVASHLQKYRVFSKKIEEANYRDQIASRPFPTSNNITPVDGSWPPLSDINPPILDTSSFSFPILETSSSTTPNPSQLANNSPSLPNQGSSSMQETAILEQPMPDSLNGQDYLIYDGAELGIENSENLVNPSNSEFMHNLDGEFTYDYGGSLTDIIQPYHEDIEMVSSGDDPIHSYMELPMNYPTNNDSFSYIQNSNGFETNYFNDQSKLLEMCPLYNDSNLNNEMQMNTNNLEVGILAEDDLLLDEADIATLCETLIIPEEPYVDHHGEFGNGSISNNLNPPDILEPSNQDVNGGNFPNIVSFESNYNEYNVIEQQLTNEETTAVDMQQYFDGYLPGFDSTFDMYDIDDQLLELESRPAPVENDTTLEDQFWNPFHQY